MIMNCLDCKIELNEQHAHGLTIDVCPSCNSIWFDRGELELFKHQTDKDQLSKLNESAEFKPKSGVIVECLRCESRTLEIGKIRGYEAGRCTGCHGVWVNPGSLKRKRSKKSSSVKDMIPDAVWVALEAVAGIFDV